MPIYYLVIESRRQGSCYETAAEHPDAQSAREALIVTLKQAAKADLKDGNGCDLVGRLKDEAGCELYSAMLRLQTRTFGKLVE